MLSQIDLSHPVILGAVVLLMLGCSVFIYRLYRRKRPHKHTPWARLYDKELH